MHHMRNGDPGEFPRFGARARSWYRIERELTRWLESPEGRFARWRARQAVVGDARMSVPAVDPRPPDYR